MKELRAEGLCRRFLHGKREVRVLQDASPRLGRGEPVFLTGESGNGETTLLKILAGPLKPDGGRVLMNGRDNTALAEDECYNLRQRVVSYLPQQLGLLRALTAVQNITLPAMFSGDKAQCKELYSRATVLLGRTGVFVLRGACPAELPGRETKRVLLARVLMTAPRSLLVDEPTADLDRESAAGFSRFFAALRAQGTGVLVATYDWSQLRAADHILRLRTDTVQDVTQEIGDSGRTTEGGKINQGNRHSFRRIAAACAAFLMTLLLTLPVYTEQKYANWQEVASAMGTVLDDVVEAYGTGGGEAGKKATEQANVAYYRLYEKPGFEKTVMTSVSGSHGSDVEHQLYLVKRIIHDGDSEEELKSNVETLKGMLTKDAITLDDGKAAAQGSGNTATTSSVDGSSGGGATWQTFLAVFGLTLRESLEAVLVIAAIIVYLVKTNYRKYLASVHIGAGLGVLFSVMLTMIFNGIVASLGDAQSSTEQEVLESVAMFPAVTILFCVSNWMLSKVEAETWSRYTKDKVQQDIDKGSMYTLSFSAFLAVTREGTELIMFFQGIRASITNNPQMLWGGLALAILILAIVYVAITKLSVRLPLKPFFTFTSVLIFILCISFIGKGIYELQKADVIGRTIVPWVNGFNFELLGTYDRYENLIP